LRICEKKTGPLESSLIKIEIMGISHDNNKIITAKEKQISNILFAK
jgi:hypothetical protein